MNLAEATMRETKPLKYLCDLNPDQLPESTPTDFEFSYVDISSVQRQQGIVESTRLRFEEAPSRARRLIQEGDVLVSTVRTYLEAIAQARAEHDGFVCSTGFAVLRPLRGIVEPRYLGYAVQSQDFVQSVVARSVGVSYPAIVPTELARITVPVPPIDAQSAIAEFLDHESERVAMLSKNLRLRADQQRELFWANQVDRYLGQGLETKSIRLKYLLGEPKLNGAWGDDPGKLTTDAACVRVADFDRRALVVRTAPTNRSFRMNQVRKLRLQRGDLLIEGSGGGDKSPVGFVVRYDLPDSALAVPSNFLGRLRPGPKQDPLYLGHLFGTLYADGRNEPFVKQVTGIQNLDTNAYLGLRVPSRNLETQESMARESEELLRVVLQAEDLADKFVQRLAEYRQSVITEAVTGRLDVAAASESEMDEQVHAALEGATESVRQDA